GSRMRGSGQIDDAAVAAVIERAAERITAAGKTQRVAVLLVWPNRAAELRVRPSGWCELGRISDVSGQFWWLIFWHWERAEGRMLRYLQPPKRGPLGEVLPKS